MSRKGYRQKPWLYIVTDPKKGWRALIGRPIAFNVEPIILPGEGPSKFDVTLPQGCNIGPISLALASRAQVPLILLVPAVGTFHFEVVPISVFEDMLNRQVSVKALMNIGTYRLRPSRKRKAARKAKT